MKKTLRGILPAVLTPVTRAGRFDEKQMERLAALLYGAGVDGLYVCGQTGEGMEFDEESRRYILETVLACTPAAKLVVAHVGARTLDEAARLAEHAGKVGADAVSSLPPQGETWEGILAYYGTLTSRSPLPVLLYHFPAAAPSISQLEQLMQLSRLPNTVGLKFTDYNLFWLEQLKRDGAIVFSGRDEVFVAGLLMGADGGIGSVFNVAPQVFLEIAALGKASKWDQAQLVQREINRFMAILLRYPWLPALKWVMRHAGVDCGPALAGQPYLTSGQEASLRTELQAASFSPETIFSRSWQPQ